MSDQGEYDAAKAAHEKAVHDQNIHVAERAHDRMDALQDFFNEHADRHAHAVLRLLLTLNGGAAIALLAFAGGLVARTTISLDKIWSITGQLQWFVYGVVANCFAAFFAYFVAYFRAGQIIFVKKSYDAPFITATSKSKKFFIASNVVQALGVACALAGFLLFAYGVYQVQQAISHLTSVQPSPIPFDAG